MAKEKRRYKMICLNLNEDEKKSWFAAKTKTHNKLGFDLSDKQFSLLLLKFWESNIDYSSGGEVATKDFN